MRSESGRTDPIEGVNVPRASRKDVRDAVKVARAASGRLGEEDRLQPRSGPLPLRRGAGVALRGAAPAGPSAGRAELGAAVDLLVHYAGWTDKLSVVMGGINPVAGPHLSFSTPEPTGVVAVLAPDEPDVLGLVREIAPVLAAGNTVVAILSRRRPLRGLDLGEVAGVSDVPGGVLNLLCGRMDELLTPLCGHRDVNAIVDATGDPSLAVTIDELASETVKRVSRPTADTDPLSRLEAVMELKTAWHPVGT